MTQPLRGYSPIDLWSPWQPDSTPVDPPSPAPAEPSPPERPPPALSPAKVFATEGAAASADARGAVQRRLDAFRLAMTPTYHTRYGDLAVPAGFRMNRTAVAGPDDLLRAAMRRAHLQMGAVAQVQTGRGTPAQIRALTQALVDVGALGALDRPNSYDLFVAVRTMMWNYDIGIDCAGYTQQAYLHATGVTRAQAHFRSLADDDLSGLGLRGYTRIRDVADVRPGDIVSLGPPRPDPRLPNRDTVGHRVIVYAQRVATAAEMRELLSRSGPAAQFAIGGPVRLLEVDSSWGAGGVPQNGGVRREQWWYNESTRQWGWSLGGDDREAPRRFAVGSTPYAHLIDAPDGFFRYP